MSAISRFTFVAAALSSIALSAEPAHAEGLPLRVGAFVGANYSVLQGPTDPAGAPTLLSGAAFSGIGFQGGLALGAPIVKLGHESVIVLELDILFSSHSGKGKAESPGTSQLREVELTSTMLRAPLLARLQWESDGFGFGALFGPELLLGLQSGSTVIEENISGTPQPLNTTPVTHVGITMGLGARMPISEKVGLPIDFRFTLDPAVPTTTRERFDNYVDFQTPGSYQVAYDYQFMLMLGIDYQLELAGE